MRLALKEIRYGKKKYILIESILILMTFMVLFLSGLANGLSRAVSAAVENQSTKEFVLSDDAQNLITLSSVSNEATQKILNQYGSSAAELNIYRGHLQKASKDKKVDVTYFAIDSKSFLAPKITTGHSLSNSGNGIVLDESYLDNGIKTGDTIKDSDTGMIFQVKGFTKDAMYGHTAVAYISLNQYTKIMQTKNPSYTKTTQTIALNKSVKKLSVSGYTPVNKSEVIKNIPGYSAEQSTIQMILWVLLVMSSAILGVFFYILTIQKERQFGVLKAIGMHMSELSKMIAAQVFILAFTGMVVGNVLVIAMSMMLPKSMPFYLQGDKMLLISVIFLLISVGGSLVSTRRIAKVDPIITIGGNEA